MPSPFDGLSVHQKRDLVALARGSILVECISQAAKEQDVDVLRQAFESGAFAYAVPGDEKRHKPLFHEDEDPTIAALACVVYGAERRHDDEAIHDGATLLVSSKLIVSDDFRQVFRDICHAYVESYENEAAALSKEGFFESEEMQSRYRTTLAVLSAAAFDDEMAFRLLDKDLTLLPREAPAFRPGRDSGSQERSPGPSASDVPKLARPPGRDRGPGQSRTRPAAVTAPSGLS